MKVETKDLFIFDMGGVSLALRMEDVEHVLPASEITKIPKTAGFVLGIAAVRGRIMSVIDGSKRLGIGGKDSDYFAVCHVRGNVTAILIGRPLEAKSLPVATLSENEKNYIFTRHKLYPKMFNGGWEILEERDARYVSSGRKLLEINADQFVSDQMASQILAG